MGEYVDIAGSVFDLIRAGQHISDLGTGLDASMTQLVGQIEHWEGAETWGTDETGTTWTNNPDGGYLAGKGGAEALPASLKKLLRPGAVAAPGSTGATGGAAGDPSIGGVAQQIGDGVVQAMQAYYGTDTDSGADIGSVEV